MLAHAQSVHTRRASRGITLVRSVGVALVVSSFVKFSHPSPVVDYMGSMGYQDGTYYVIAAGELVIAVMLLVARSRWLGLLLASAYLGGAVAAHVAIHRYAVGGPFLEFMATNPFVGALLPGAFLALLWAGAWLYWSEVPHWPQQAVDAGPDVRRKLYAA